jgi:HNH endonuclease
VASPSQARNAIKRSLKALIDPKPSKAQVDQIWAYFGSACSYCGEPQESAARKAHIDHLVAEAEGGSNQLCNLVLSCASCNGDEKRDLPWQAFLQTKCTCPDVAAARQQKIQSWASRGQAQLTPQQQASIQQAFDQVNSVYSQVVAELRHLHSNH